MINWERNSMLRACRLLRVTILLAAISASWSQDADALYRAGLRLLADRQPGTAIAPLEQSVARRPAFAAAWKALGIAYASQQDYERAEPAFRAACDRQPSLEDACLYHGRTLYLLDRFQPAIDVLRRAIGLRDTAEAHRLLALCLEGVGRSPEAAGEFLTALRLARKTAPDEDPGIDYGVYLFRLGQPEKALEPLDEAIARHPDSARAHLEAGCVLLALDRVEEAAAHLERSVAINPQSSRAHLLLGKAYLRLGKAEAAEAHLLRAR
jgi:tetratricopeptide (TPR) repeat protein